MDKKLQRGIIIVFVTNVINLFFSLATNFLLPKYLPVDTYAGIKTYQLYITYIGLLHLGYVDGVYLKFGGQDIGKTLDKDFTLDLRMMRLLELGISIISVIIAILLRNLILVCFSLSILPINMNSYYKYLYQATGQFDRYGRIMNFSSLATFVVNMGILFIFHVENYKAIILIYALLSIFIWLVLEIRFYRLHSFEKPDQLLSWEVLANNIKTGIFLTIGNLASLLLSSMDRWFVKVLLSNYSFALYSFAISVEGLLNIAITPVTTTLYNYFCREKSAQKHNTVLNYLVLFATILPLAAFPVKFILEHFLQKYLDASHLVFVLFGSQIFVVLINSVYVNLYKVFRQQKTYFIKLCAMLLLGFVLNTIFYFVLRANIGFAIGTLITSIVWFFITIYDFNYLKISFKTMAYIFVCLFSLITLGLLFDSVLGFFLYFIVWFIMGIIFMNNTFNDLLLIIKSKMKRLASVS